MFNFKMCQSMIEILKILRRKNCTVEELSNKLKISPTAVRQHLSSLEGESLIKGEPLRGEMGRPKYVYSLTEKAEELFPKKYSFLLDLILSELIEKNLMGEFVDRVAKKMSKPYHSELVEKSLHERFPIVLRILDDMDHDTSFEERENEYEIKVYNCPYYNISLKYPEICEIDLTFIKNLLGVEVLKNASISDGNMCCSYIVKK